MPQQYPYYMTKQMAQLYPMAGTAPSPATSAAGQPMYPLPPIGGELPTGLPVGASMLPPPAVPPSQLAQIPMPSAIPMPPISIGQAPQTVQDAYYTPGFLRSMIGRKMRVEFLIGSTGPLVDRLGVLLTVGASYILLRLEESDDVVMCDIYSIKFVTIFY